jgi:cytochrome c2
MRTIIDFKLNLKMLLKIIFSILVALSLFIAGIIYEIAQPSSYTMVKEVADLKKFMKSAKSLFKNSDNKFPPNEKQFSVDDSFKIIRTHANIIEFRKIPLSSPGGRNSLCTISDEILLLNSKLILSLFSKNGVLLSKIDLAQHFSLYTKNKSPENFAVTDILCVANKDNLSILVATSFKLFGDKDKYGLAVHELILTNKLEILKIITRFQNNSLRAVNGAGRLARCKTRDTFLISVNSIDGEEDTMIPNLRPDKYDAQDDSKLEGKILQIDLAGNSVVYSRGHRNPQGLFWGHDNKIYETEHGPRGGDELNIIQQNANYGWPLTSSGLGYKDYTSIYGELGRDSNSFQLPLAAWNPSIGISHGVEVDLNSWSEWKNDLLIGSLKNRSLYRVRLAPDRSRVIFIESIWIGERIRSIALLKDSIALSTDSDNLILLKKASTLDSNFFDIRSPKLAQCQACHHFGNTEQTSVAPSFTKVLSRPIASDLGFTYSEALKNYKGIWTEEKFVKFLLDPQAVVPGTTMKFKVGSPNEALAIYRELTKENQGVH